MNINLIQEEEKTVLALSGRLDTLTSQKLQEALIPAFKTANHVEIDFAQLVYVTSAGLRVLLMGEKTAKAQGGRQTLVNVSPEIMEVFDMTGFSNILTIL